MVDLRAKLVVGWIKTKEKEKLQKSKKRRAEEQKLQMSKGGTGGWESVGEGVLGIPTEVVFFV